MPTVTWFISYRHFRVAGVYPEHRDLRLLLNALPALALAGTRTFHALAGGGFTGTVVLAESHLANAMRFLGSPRRVASVSR
ncbi:MAG: hypothetical protein ABI593_08750 [Betaproteobacteria bacterium]